MHVLRPLRIFIPLLLVAAIVAGIVLVVTSRSELQNSRKDVDVTWSSLRTQLDDRYKTLGTANQVVRTVPGPLHQIVTDVAAANEEWRTLEENGSSVGAEVEAANTLESLGRRLVESARVAPRLKGKTQALGAIEAFANLAPPKTADEFNAAVDHFEKERNRPARQLAVRLLGYGAIPTFDAIPPG